MEMSNIVADDGAGTPVSHTFTPQEGQVSKAGFASWLERLAGKAAAMWPQLQTRAALAEKRGQDSVTQLRLIMPILRTVDDVETVVGQRKYFVTCTAPYGYDVTSDLETDFGLLKNVLANAQVTSLVTLVQPSH